MGWFHGGSAAGETRHPCAGAGRWYPADPEELRDDIAGYLKNATATQPKGRVEAVIVPHAGYVYSGPIAGEAFKTLRGRDDIRRVVILAFSHSYRVRGISVLDVDAYETPLGDVRVDRPVVQSLLKDPLFNSIPQAHATEHSDENQLPFLQVALGGEFKLVSLFVGRMDPSDFDPAADALKPFIDEHTVLVVSSDFTHYGEAAYGFDPFHGRDVKERMAKLDHGAIERICDKDFPGFRDYVDATSSTICGVQPISLLLKVLPPGAKGHLLKYKTSADIAGGDYSMAVGYAAIVFDEEQSTAKKADDAATEASKPKATTAPILNPEGPASELQMLDLLNKDEQSTLLRLARATLERAFQNDPPRLPPDLGVAEIGTFNITPTLRRKYGAFVTLTIDGALRGCIGYIVGREPVCDAVMHNALNAAFEDPRFSPMTKKEFKDAHIEISVLSPLEPVQPEDVVVGRDGLVITSRGRSGVLLPQVPVEQGWTRVQFLDYVCRKAGLPKGAWRDEDVILQRFGAQVFEEE